MKFKVGDKVIVDFIDPPKKFNGIITQAGIKFGPEGQDYAAYYFAGDEVISSGWFFENQLSRREEEPMPYTARTVTETVYQYLVPFPAAHTEVSKAWTAAADHYRNVNPKYENAFLPDDALQFIADRHNIIIQFKGAENDDS